MGCCDGVEMAFQVPRLDNIISALGVNPKDLLDKLNELEKSQPNLKDAIEKAKVWFDGAVAPGVSPAAVGVVFAEAVKEWASGKPGYNPHHGGLAS